MTHDVWFAGNSLSYVEGAGQLWIHLNWVLSLEAAGCRVTWVELVEDDMPWHEVASRYEELKRRVGAFGLSDRVWLAADGRIPPAALQPAFVAPDQLDDVDLLLSLCYWFPAGWVRRARRSALVDIDPGLLQIWMDDGDIIVAPHDHYFTIGETVGTDAARFPDCDLTWNYTPPPVYLPAWPVHTLAKGDAPYTTITHWWEDGWVCYDGEEYQNDKRSSFVEFFDVARRVPVSIELATNLTEGDEDDRVALIENGWLVQDSATVTATLERYRSFIQNSRGEFSCAKPSCMKLQNTWVSDRTICYLASGRPAVVQYTGPSKVLPDAYGIFRFRTPDEAVAALRAVETDYEGHAAAARRLAVETFDGERIARSVLERCL